MSKVKVRKSVGRIIQEFILDEYRKSGMSMYRFDKTYNSIAITTLSKVIHDDVVGFKTTSIDNMLEEFDTDLSTIIKKYGEYETK